MEGRYKGDARRLQDEVGRRAACKIIELGSGSLWIGETTSWGSPSTGDGSRNRPGGY